MKLNSMYRIILLLLLFITINTHTVFAQTQSFQIKSNFAFYTEKFLGVKNG